MRARFLMLARLAAPFTTCQMASGVIPAPQILSSRLTRRKIAPPLMPAATVHSSTARFAQTRTGTVRMCFPLPTRSAMTECSSRTWKSSVLRPTNSARRSPHPMSRAGVARSRLSRRPGDGDSRSSVLDSRPSTSFQSSPRDVSPLLHDGSLHQVRTQKPAIGGFIGKASHGG